MASNFLDTLLSGGAGYRVTFTSDGASLKPVDDSDAALKIFQSVVSQVEANEGYGYRIFNFHESSDRPGNRVDLLLIKFDEGGVSHSEEGRLAFKRGTDIFDCPYSYPPFRDAWKAGWEDAAESSGARP
jgi:hypothetical protein